MSPPRRAWWFFLAAAARAEAVFELGDEGITEAFEPRVADFGEHADDVGPVFVLAFAGGGVAGEEFGFFGFVEGAEGPTAAVDAVLVLGPFSFEAEGGAKGEGLGGFELAVVAPDFQGEGGGGVGEGGVRGRGSPFLVVFSTRVWSWASMAAAVGVSPACCLRSRMVMGGRDGEWGRGNGEVRSRGSEVGGSGLRLRRRGLGATGTVTLRARRDAAGTACGRIPQPRGRRISALAEAEHVADELFSRGRGGRGRSSGSGRRR